MKDLSLWDARDFLGLVDVLGSLLLLWAMQRITTRAGLRTAQGRWALFRRMVYCEMSVALFGLGVERFLGEEYRDSDVISLFQAMMLFGVLIFPLLRATGLITQDAFVSVDGVRHHSD